MLNDFTWNMTGYIPKHQVNPHGDGIIPYVAERIFQLEPEPPSVGNLNEYILSALLIGIQLKRTGLPMRRSGIFYHCRLMLLKNICSSPLSRHLYLESLQPL